MKWLYTLKPGLTADQMTRFANIFDNAGQVILGVAVLSPLITSKTDPLIILSGIILTLFCWLVSLWLTKKGQDDV